MFGPSFWKLAVLIAVIAAVWYGWKYLQRVDAVRKTAIDQRRRHPPARAGEAEDMVKCSVCGTYVAAQTGRGCARPNCPWAG